MAIDRDTITSALGFGVHVPTRQHIPSTSRGYNPDPNYGVPAYDPVRARQLIEEAGAVGLTFNLYPRPGSVFDATAVAIAQMLEDVGLNPQLVFMEAGGYTAMRREEGWDGLLICVYISMFNNEDTARVNFMHTPGLTPNWLSVVPTEEFQELIDAPMFFGDNTREIMAQSDYIIDNLLVIPLWSQGHMHIVHPRLKGWIPADHMLFFERLWLDD